MHVSEEGVPAQFAAGAHPGRAGAVTAVVVGLALTVAAVATACAQQPPGPVGASSAAALAASAAPTRTASGVPVVPGAPPAAAAVLAPAGLRIDVLHLSARVEPVGVDEHTGEVAVPPSVDVVGWYRYGPGLDATAGSIVIAGHVDSAKQGDGAFFRLRELTPGAGVAVTGADGTVHRFTVVAREVYPKTRIPLERYFARDGAVRLTLITCGGPFDAGTGHYRDNVVVTAQPAR